MRIALHGNPAKDIDNSNVNKGWNMRAIVSGAALLVGLGAAAHADTMASAPAHGSNAQTVAVCYIYNLSSSGLKVSSVQIVKEPAGAVLPSIAYNCPGAMGAGG